MQKDVKFRVEHMQHQSLRGKTDKMVEIFSKKQYAGCI